MPRDGAVTAYVDVNRSPFGAARSLSFAPARRALRLVAAVIGAASLAACAQSSVVSERSQALASRTASSEPVRTTASPARTRVAAVRRHTPYASRKKPAETRTASQGVASFYSEAQQTASGEKFDGRDLTAAHPTLPFGTRLRVTDVKSGRSVTVRVNDRGPYVPGRVVDVSYSAAQSLGMIGKGVANVRLDVVQ
jgi:rare lipoprotein A